jgi:hypothetical protein
MARSETKKAKSTQAEPAPEAVKPDSEAGGGPRGGGKRDRELVVKPIAIDKDARLAMREARDVARDASRSSAEKSAATVAVALMLNGREQVDVLDRADAADELEKRLEEANHALEIAEKRQVELTASNSAYVELVEAGLKERANLLDRLDLAERMNASLRADLKVGLQKASEAEGASADARARLDALAPEAMLSAVAGAIAGVTGAVKSIPPAPHVDLAGPVDQIITRLSSDVRDAADAVTASAAKSDQALASLLRTWTTGVMDQLAALTEASGNLVGSVRGADSKMEILDFSVGSLNQAVLDLQNAQAAKHQAILERIDAMEKVMTEAMAKLG